MVLENIEGMMKFRRDISSRRLFCKGVPVSSKRCSACREGEREFKLLCAVLLDVKDKNAKNSDDRQEDITETRGGWGYKIHYKMSVNSR